MRRAARASKVEFPRPAGTVCLRAHCRGGNVRCMPAPHGAALCSERCACGCRHGCDCHDLRVIRVHHVLGFNVFCPSCIFIQGRQSWAAAAAGTRHVHRRRVGRHRLRAVCSRVSAAQCRSAILQELFWLLLPGLESLWRCPHSLLCFCCRQLHALSLYSSTAARPSTSFTRAALSSNLLFPLALLLHCRFFSSCQPLLLLPITRACTPLRFPLPTSSGALLFCPYCANSHFSLREYGASALGFSSMCSLVKDLLLGYDSRLPLVGSQVNRLPPTWAAMWIDFHILLLLLPACMLAEPEAERASKDAPPAQKRAIDLANADIDHATRFCNTGVCLFFVLTCCSRVFAPTLAVFAVPLVSTTVCSIARQLLEKSSTAIESCGKRRKHAIVSDVAVNVLLALCAFATFMLAPLHPVISSLRPLTTRQVAPAQPLGRSALQRPPPSLCTNRPHSSLCCCPQRNRCHPPYHARLRRFR